MPFLLVASSVLLASYIYLGNQLIPGDAATTAAAWIALAAPYGLVLWLPLSYWKRDVARPSRRDERMLWASYSCMGWLSFLFFFTAARDLLLLGARFWSFARGIWDGAGFVASLASAASGWIGGPARVPAWLVDGRGSLLILALSLAALAVGFREARRAPTVERVDVPIPGLPAGLEGTRIAQVSDLHVGSTIQRPFVERVVEAVNALDADLVALTGDLIDGPVELLAPHFAPLAGLRSKLGTFYVTGNHEYYWGADDWVRHARSLGIVPLLNSHAVVERGGAKLVVAGVLDLWAARAEGGGAASDPIAAIEGAPLAGAVRVLLAHQPKTALAAAALGYDLQLSGHTHGGQFLPWTLAVRWFQPFTRGLHRVGRMWLYVNRGTGYWGPPVRLGSPSEITLLRLVQAP